MGGANTCNLVWNYIQIGYARSADLEITVEFLAEVDKLVQMIESPIFACE